MVCEEGIRLMGQLSTSLYGAPDGSEEGGSGELVWESFGSMGSSSSKSVDDIEEKDKPIIMVLGGPGSGKATQCVRLEKEFGLKHISLGDILREEVKNGTQVGKECSKIMKDGKLVPVNLTMELLKKAMKNSAGTSGYLLDGFPRATSQARAFQKQVKAPSLVLYLHAPQNVLLHRLLNRGQSSGRADDNAETIKKRFNAFKRESLPVLHFYENNSASVMKKVCTIEPPDDVYKHIQTAVRGVIPATTRFRRHVRRRVVNNKNAQELHVKRIKSRGKKRGKLDHADPYPPPPPVYPCVIM